MKKPSCPLLLLLCTLALILMLAACSAPDAQTTDSTADNGTQSDSGTDTPEKTDNHSHSFAKTWTHDPTHHWKESTCGHNDVVAQRQEHAFDQNYNCTVCDYQKPPTAGLDYRLNDDGASYEVAGLGSATDTDIIIAASHEGLPVTKIGYSAFQGCTELTSVLIPDSVQKIDGNAFNYCHSLTKIVIPDSVVHIGSTAFADCSALESITIGTGLSYIGSYAFTDCEALKEVHISDLSAWCNITFANDTTSNPLSFAENLYYNGTLLTDLVIPESITRINAFAFCHSSSLQSITIHSGVKEIDMGAFLNCTQLRTVRYLGTEEEWSRITVGLDNDPLINAEIIYP